MEVFTGALRNLGVIQITGADARGFLHSQLTQEVTGLAENEARLAGYCSAKGRLYAVMHLFAVGETVYMVTRRELIESLMKRLRMFVLRAKVVFEDVSQSLQVQGVCSSTALTNQQLVHTEQGFRVGVLPVQINGQSHLRELRLAAQVEGKDEAQLWDWLDIQAGMPHIELSSYEAFVPQMVNLDRIGGVNFKKGCYPGQEVVARSHYLGKLKRRMQLARLDGETVVPTAGADVFSSLDVTQASGQIVNAIAHEGGVDVLYEISLPMLADDAALSTPMCTKSWQKLDLPYSLKDENSISSV